MLRGVSLSDTKTLGSLTERQRRMLAAGVDHDDHQARSEGRR
jgi:hypothetical protein